MLSIGTLWFVLATQQICPASTMGSWVEGDQRAIGATRDSYNKGAGLRWSNRMGDWTDRKGLAQGKEPWAIGRYNKSKAIDLDVTEIYVDSLSNPALNHGFFLRLGKPSASMALYSKEAKDSKFRPRLIVVYKDGSTEEYEPSADVAIHASSHRSNGAERRIKLQPGTANILMRFPLARERAASSIKSVRLRLQVAKLYGKQKGVIELYRPAAGHGMPAIAPMPGLAVGYVGDNGISRDANVHFATDFSGEDWEDSIGELPRSAKIVETQNHGPALQVTVPKGKTLGLNAEFNFSKAGKAEPSHVFFRYYVRFSDNWRPAVGGKLPGIAGTYGKGGWGGRRANGRNGWSARGGFRRSIVDGDGNMHVPLTSYVYYPDSKHSPYGDHFSWGIAQRGVLRVERWYCVEQELKLNTPGEKDGYLNVWIDGRPALQRSGLRFRDVENLKIEKVWLNVYHGGTTPAPADLTMLIDNIVIADKYIGPAKLSTNSKDWWTRLQ